MTNKESTKQSITTGVLIVSIIAVIIFIFNFNNGSPKKFNKRISNGQENTDQQIAINDEKIESVETSSPDKVVSEGGAVVDPIAEDDYGQETNMAEDGSELDKKVKAVLNAYSYKNVFRINGQVKEIGDDYLNILQTPNFVRLDLHSKVVFVKIKAAESGEIISVEEIKNNELKEGAGVSVLAVKGDGDKYVALVVKIIVF